MRIMIHWTSDNAGRLLAGMVRGHLFVLFFALVASLPGRLDAQDNAEDDAARSLFRLGEAAYFEGRFDESLRYFQQAYELSHRAQLLFNIGQAADRAGDQRRALASFESYLAQVESSPNHAFVVARIEVLRRAVAAEDEARAGEPADATNPANAPPESSDSETAAPSSDDDASSSRGRRIAGWATASAGVAALALGATFLPLGLEDHSSVENVADGTTWSEIRDSYDRASPRIVAGAVLLGIGAAASAVGLTIALRARSAGDSPIELRASATGVTIRGRF